MQYWRENNNGKHFEYARKLTAEFSKSFYMSGKMLPKERRWATYALYGFCRYADNLVDKPRNRSKDEILTEVDGFENELRLAYRTGESEHPVISSFIVVAKKYGIPMEYPLDLIEGVKMDINKNRYENFDELYVFCYRVAAVVGLMMTHVMGYRSEAAFEYAEKLGIAMQLTNILRDIKEDKDMNRIYLPLDELKEYGLSAKDVLNENMNERFNEFMQFQVARAHQYYDEAQAGIAMLENEVQFAIYSASRVYRGILYQIEERDFNPFIGRVFVSQRKKLTILFHELLKKKTRGLQERLHL